MIDRIKAAFVYQKQNVVGVVIKGVWLTVALICIIISIVVLVNNSGEMGFGAWLMAGAICCIPIIGIMLTFIINMKRSGAASGESYVTTHYYVDSSYRVNSYTTNRRFLYTILYVAVALLVSCLIGPVILIAIFIWKNIDFVRNIIDLAKDR